MVKPMQDHGCHALTESGCRKQSRRHGADGCPTALTGSGVGNPGCLRPCRNSIGGHAVGKRDPQTRDHNPVTRGQRALIVVLDLGTGRGPSHSDKDHQYHRDQPSTSGGSLGGFVVGHFGLTGFRSPCSANGHLDSDWGKGGWRNIASRVVIEQSSFLRQFPRHLPGAM